MTAIKRYYYYIGPQRESAKIHLCFASNFAEGNLTRCGRPTRAGWGYWIGVRTVPKNRAICAQCRP